MGGVGSGGLAEGAQRWMTDSVTSDEHGQVPLSAPSIGSSSSGSGYAGRQIDQLLGKTQAMTRPCRHDSRTDPSGKGPQLHASCAQSLRKSASHRRHFFSFFFSLLFPPNHFSFSSLIFETVRSRRFFFFFFYQVNTNFVIPNAKLRVALPGLKGYSSCYPSLHSISVYPNNRVAASAWNF